ncbi:tgf-beta-activated kinase 1 and map3k7-binding protein [Plakobranchus ocellatus]|uniref:Tgf-beta-activated kinase 1 and map3k7-binding protein n=1 Tax=Plakobranchus ocellatus TaxID=259542 RepID=A0AAV4AQG9_9GAST|nr:tgf-beta-activated kinase 1 and map3k7-binding protein [Plakobranchus ocellatus]
MWSSDQPIGGYLHSQKELEAIIMQDPALSWTDDLPVCHLSGVGLSTNQIYREDGNRREAHAFEDRNFHFRHDTCFLYGVFDGHNGTRVADFAAQRIPAELLSARVEPVIADPFVDGGVEIDSSSAFLVLMSDGLYQALTDATGTETVNGDIATMVAQEFGQQTTLTGVAQAVVDRVIRIHHDTFMTGSEAKKTLCKKRDDITLLVRNFNYPLSIQSPGSVRSINSPSSQTPQHMATGFPSSVYNHHNSPLPSAVSSPASDASRHQRSSESDSPKTPTNYMLTGPSLLGVSNTNTNSTDTPTNGSSTYSTNSSGEMHLFSQRQSNNANLELDAEGKVKAYVDFSEWDLAISKMTDEQRENLFKELMPKSVYDPIQEEPSSDN